VKCAGLILAAGESSRMGSPKALLAYEGEPFLDRLAGVFSTQCGEVIVVLGHHGQALREAARRPMRFVENPDPSRGMLSSLQCGLRAAGDAEAVLFTPVDYPAIQQETIARLIAALAAEPDALLAIPRCDGRRGHPVACRRAIVDELLALPVDARASDVIHAHRDRTVYVDVDDAGIAMDVDDPAAYQRLLAGVGR
jgi:CTP:molybdopterin cytidylyltransferase MocA